jgi:hypothetical protein
MFLPAGCIAYWAEWSVVSDHQLVGYDWSDRVWSVVSDSVWSVVSDQLPRMLCQIRLLDQMQLPWCACNQQTHRSWTLLTCCGVLSAVMWNKCAAFRVPQRRAVPSIITITTITMTMSAVTTAGFLAKMSVSPEKEIRCVASLSGLLSPARAHNLAPSFPLCLLSLVCLLDLHSLVLPCLIWVPQLRVPIYPPHSNFLHTGTGETRTRTRADSHYSLSLPQIGLPIFHMLFHMLFQIRTAYSLVSIAILIPAGRAAQAGKLGNSVKASYTSTLILRPHTLVDCGY